MKISSSTPSKSHLPLSLALSTIALMAMLPLAPASDELPVKGEPQARQPARPSRIRELEKRLEELKAAAEERARQAEAAAAAAQQEAEKARAEAAESQRTIAGLEDRINHLEQALNRALTALDSLQKESESTEARVQEVKAKAESTQQEIAAAKKEIAQVKADTRGAVTSANSRFTLYGFVLANTAFADSQLFIQDIPLWAQPDAQRLALQPITGQSPGVTERAGDIETTLFTARQTRLGFRASFPRAGGWTPSSVVEIDFFGARPVAGQGSTFNQPRIRLGYVSLEHTSGLRLVAGQDWVIFAPVNPTSWAHVSIPQAAAAGNPWMRLPQIRVERTFRFEENGSFQIQSGILRAVSGGDAPAAGSLLDLPSLSGERAVHPIYQTRFALSAPALGKTLTLGLSGTYGRENTGLNLIDSWGTAIDYSFPLHAKVGLKGELFIGSNLDTFQAGIFQSAALAGRRFRKIDTGGGWIELGITATDRWSFNIGYGQDDPENRDLNLGMRAKNQLWWTNIFYKLHPNVIVALEYNYFNTRHLRPRFDPSGTRVGTANWVNLAFAYTF